MIEEGFGGAHPRRLTQAPTVKDAAFGTGWWHRPNDYSVSNNQDPLSFPGFLQATIYEFDPVSIKNFHSEDWLDTPFNPEFVNENVDHPKVVGTYLKTPPLGDAGYTISFAFRLRTLHAFHEYDLLTSGFRDEEGNKINVHDGNKDFFRIVVRGTVGSTPNHMQVYGSEGHPGHKDLHARPNGRPGPTINWNQWNIVQVVLPAAGSPWASELARVYHNGSYIGPADSSRLPTGVTLSGEWVLGGKTMGNGQFHGSIQNFYTFSRELSDSERQAVYGHTAQCVHNYVNFTTETGHNQTALGTYPPVSTNVDAFRRDPYYDAL